MPCKPLFITAYVISTVAWAAPYVPKDDAAVIERLPGRRDAPAMVELRQLRAAAASRPDDAQAAAALAHRFFELANAEGDPRYIGYGEAAIAHWNGTDAPADIHYVRGLLVQYRHDFDPALAEFAAALQKDPGHFGARAWRAAIFMVRANYPAAEAECAALPADPDDLYVIGCHAYVEATTGHTRAAYARLSEALGAQPDAEPQIRLWALTRLAEMAWRLEDAPAAERLFRQAFDLDIEDNFLLAAYSDFLLDQGRPKEVVALLKQWERSDTLLLRLALAEKRLGMREATAHIQALGDRFAAAALRGERLHMGEEARYLLDLKGDPKKALAVGLENWKDQREPRDAQVVLEAAKAAGDTQSAAPVLQWLQETGFENRRMHEIASTLK